MTSKALRHSTIRPGVYFMRVDPDSPELLTVRAQRLLAAGDAVVFDGLFEAEACEVWELPSERWSLGTENPPAIEDELVAFLGDSAANGARVLWLTSLVPSRSKAAVAMMGRLAQQEIPFEVLPGVEDGQLLESCLGVSWGESPTWARLEVRLASEKDVEAHQGLLEGWVGAQGQALAVHGTAPWISLVIESLIGAGQCPSTEALAVVDPGRPSQRVAQGTLADVMTRARRVGAGPMWLVLAPDLQRRQTRAWWEQMPLLGKKILVPRTKEQAQGTADALRSRGARPFLAPTIEIHPPSDAEPLRKALRDLGKRYDWVVFTSENGVERTWKALDEGGLDARIFGHCKLAVIGPGTASALRGKGLVPDFMASEFRGEGLAEAILSAMRADASLGRRVLLPRAKVAREALPDALREGGCTVDVVEAYETRAPMGTKRDRILEFLRGGGDAVVFTSTSTVDNMMEMLGDDAKAQLKSVCLAAIGPITASALARHGLAAHTIAAEYTIPGLVDALETYFRARGLTSAR
jgi:uroporphyrinogen III methyltransferase/synthase